MAERSNDHALVERCRSGEEQAWNELYERYWPVVYKFVYQFDWRISLEDAEELAQEVFIKAVRGIDRFRGDCSIKTWLLRIATSCVFDWLARAEAAKRGKGLATVRFDEVTGLLDVEQPAQAGADDPAIKACQTEILEVIAALLERLPSKYRVLVHLRFFEGLSYEEIGAVLRLKPKTVSSRLSRCMSRLRGYLEKALGQRTGKTV